MQKYLIETVNAMTNEQFDSHQQPNTSTDFTRSASNGRKTIAECPICAMSFTSRSELRSHMEDPPNHASAVDIDAVSFGEMSSDIDSADEGPNLSKSSKIQSDDEPRRETNGFEFPSSPALEKDDFESTDSYGDLPTYETVFTDRRRFNAEQGSVHTVHDEDEQPSAEHRHFEHDTKASMAQSASNRYKPKPAMGVLYCDVCNKYFGNEKVFKRHFMFGIKHGEESEDLADLYYRAWAKTWMDEARDTESLRKDSDAVEV